MELFNSWDLSAADQKKLKNYWERFENYVKPHSNELIAAWELHNLLLERIVSRKEIPCHSMKPEKWQKQRNQLINNFS